MGPQQRKAFELIGLTRSDAKLANHCDIISAKDMLKSITDIFERRNFRNLVLALRYFFSAKMSGNEEMLSYFNEVKIIASIIKSMGTDILNSGVAMPCRYLWPVTALREPISALVEVGDDPRKFITERGS